MSDGKKDYGKMGQESSNQNNIEEFFNVAEKQLAVALPKHLEVPKLTRSFQTALLKNPELRKCTVLSMFNAAIECAHMGLEPGRLLHLVPFKTKLTVIVDYKGLIELARRSSQVISVNAVCVYENEPHEYREGLNRTCKHTPLPRSKRGENKIAAYAVIQYKDGYSDFEWMWTDDILDIRNRSAGYRKDPEGCIWVKHEDEMFKKTTVRRGSKRWPQSAEMQYALDRDEDLEPIHLGEAERNEDLEEILANGEKETLGGEDIKTPEQEIIPPERKEGDDPNKVTSGGNKSPQKQKYILTGYHSPKANGNKGADIAVIQVEDTANATVILETRYVNLDKSIGSRVPGVSDCESFDEVKYILSGYSGLEKRE